MSDRGLTHDLGSGLTPGLTHLDPLGRARMVDVTPKDPTHRRAIARGKVFMQPETTSLVARGAISKGDVLAVARVAGIQAAKRTPDLIPLCHPLLVGSVLVNFRIEDTYIEVEAQVETVDRTGVEMEALTACTVAAPDDLRHVQVGRPVDGDRRGRALGEDRRPLGHLPPDARRRRAGRLARHPAGGSNGPDPAGGTGSVRSRTVTSST